MAPVSAALEAMRGLKLELMREEIRHARADATTAELELQRAQAAEKDRLAKNGAHRVLNLFGPIMPELTDEVIGALQLWERRDPGQPITVMLNSPGGSVIDGNAVFDTMQRLRRKGHHITTWGTGMVASMGVTLLQAGDERVLDARGILMIHEISLSNISGKIGDFADVEAFVKKLHNQSLDILSERSNLSRRQIAAMMKRKDVFMTSAEALKHGFVDRVE